MRRNYVAAARRRIIAVALAVGALSALPGPAQAQLVVKQDPLPRPVRSPVVTLISSYADGAAEIGFTERLGLVIVRSSRRLARDLRGPGTIEQVAFGQVRSFAADVRQVSILYRPARTVTLDAGFTRLRQRSSPLASRATDSVDPAGRTQTDGMTLGSAVALGQTVLLSASATLGRIRQGAAPDLATGSGGRLITSSFEASLTKSRLFGRGDRARLSLAQPMFVEHGAAGAAGTGGPASRHYVSELLYARSLMGGGGELSLFGRTRLAADPDRRTAALLAGARMRLLF